MFNDYTINKNSDNIEYPFANGEQRSYSQDDFLTDNPDKSAEDYAVLKKTSDDDLHERKLNDYNTTYLNWNLELCDKQGLCWVKSPEDFLIAKINAEEYARRRERQVAIAKKALATLTEKQYRRYVLHVAYELTLREIAEQEGVNHSKIQKSVDAAKRKIQKVVDGEWRN